MNKASLKNHELDLALKNHVKKEREILSEILSLIQEVYRRKLYLQMGYSSLFAYLTEHIGYSGSAAMRRIDTMRLTLEIPEVAEKLTAGMLNMNQISELQKASREYIKQQKIHRDYELKNSSDEKKNQPFPAAGSGGSTKEQLHDQLLHSKRAVLNKLIELPQDSAKQKNTQKIIAQILDVPLKQNTYEFIQKDESVRIEVTLSKSQYEKLKKMKIILSHVVPDGDFAALLECLSDRVIAQKTRMPSSQKIKVENSKEQLIADQESLIQETEKTDVDIKSAVIAKDSIQLTSPYSKLHMEILKKHSTCQYVDPKTQKQCAADWQLQVEHIQPQWAEGANEIENLTVLCSHHNKYRYLQQCGRVT